MACVILKTRPMSLWQVKENGGFEHGFTRVKPRSSETAAQYHQRRAEQLARDIEVEKAKIVGADGYMTMCGEPLGENEQCACGALADLLCDHPIGDGKTCDLALCDTCARKVGEDLHLCRIHFAEFRGLAGTDKINPWPPPR